MKTKLLLLLILLTTLTKGQGTFDPYFYQDFLNAHLKNPAYTGISEFPTLTFVTHTAPSDAYLFGIAYQQTLDAAKGGIGASYYYTYNDPTSGTSSHAHNLNFQYSPTFKINRDIGFKPGIELGIVVQTNKITGMPAPFNIDITTTYFNSMAGIVIFGKEFHTGIGFGIKGFGNSYVAAIPGYPSFQEASFNFDFAVNINSHDREKTWTVTPNIFFMQNENNGLTIAGVTFRYLPLLLGMHLESDNVGNFYYIPMVGTWDKYYRISFCYQHLTARPPKNEAHDYLELNLNISLPSNSVSTAQKFTRIF